MPSACNAVQTTTPSEVKGDIKRTDTHHDQKPCHEPPEIDQSVTAVLHEVIGVGAAVADPVGERGEDVGCDDEERQVVVPQSGGEDDEEEADGEDLCGCEYAGCGA